MPTSSPRPFGVLVDCSNTCTQCADACLSEEDVAMMATCIRLDLDCADICSVTSRVVSRQTEYDAAVTRALLAACAQSCKSCGDECAGHGDNMAHCKICAEACRGCEDACNCLASAMAG